MKAATVRCPHLTGAGAKAVVKVDLEFIFLASHDTLKPVLVGVTSLMQVAEQRIVAPLPLLSAEPLAAFGRPLRALFQGRPHRVGGEQKIGPVGLERVERAAGGKAFDGAPRAIKADAGLGNCFWSHSVAGWRGASGGASVTIKRAA